MMWQLWSQQWAASPWKVGVLQVLYVHVPIPLRLTGGGKCGDSVWDPCLLGLLAALFLAGACRVCGHAWALADMKWIACVWELRWGGGGVGWGVAVWELTAWCGHYSAVCESPECVCVCVCVPADSFSHSAGKDHTVCRQQMARVCDLISMYTVEWESHFWLVILVSYKDIFRTRITGLSRDHLITVILALVRLQPDVTLRFLSEEKYAGLFLSLLPLLLPLPLISYALISQILPDGSTGSLCVSQFLRVLWPQPPTRGVPVRAQLRARESLLLESTK